MDDQILVTVTYRVRGSDDPGVADILRTAFADAAPRLAALPGLIWKIWAVDPERAVGQGVYLFASSDSARDFVFGGTIEALSRLPYITELRVTRARINTALSLITHAGPALGAPVKDAEAAA